MSELAPPVIAIAGPTAAGKTQLALALCERFDRPGRRWRGAEIISVDSAQVYRGMDIGTAKPDPATRLRIPHHLVDILDPAESYSAARFAADAATAIAAIQARGRAAILVGGTMLYFRALLEGLSVLPSADADVRARIAAFADGQGWAAVHAHLAERDPQTAARLHPNDAQRIARALEIIELTGQPLSAAYAAVQSPVWSGPVQRWIVCPPQRDILHQRIEQRFMQMINDGLVDEVAALRERPDLNLELPSMRAVGYRQIWQYLDGMGSLDDAIQRGIAATRRYAKRQLTWLRSETEWTWLDGPDIDEVVRLTADL